MTSFRNLFFALILILAGCTNPAGQHTHSGTDLADKLYQQGCLAYENEELDSCVSNLTRAFRLYQEIGEKEKMSIVCLTLGEFYNETNSLDSAKFYLAKGVECIHNNASMDSIRGRLLTNLAGSYILEGDIAQSKTFYLAALEATRKSGDNEAYLVNCSSLGVTYRRSNQIDSALYYYEKGLDAALRSEDYSSLANLHDNIAVLYTSSKRIDEAKEHAQKAIMYAEKGDDASDLIQAYFISGSILTKTKEYDQSITLLRKAYQTASQQPSPRLKIKILSALLPALQATNQDDSLHYYLNVCEQHLEELPETSNEVIGIYETKATLLQKEKKYQESLEIYRKLAALRNTNASIPSDVWYRRIAECYQNLQQPANAYTYMKRAFEMRDSLNLQEADKQMSELQVRYKTQEKELEIKKLKEIQQQEELRNLQHTIWLTILISIMVIVLIVLLYKRKLQKEKTEKMAQDMIRQEQETQLRLSRKYIDGMESERTRLARELHDGVCNELLALEIGVKAEQDEGNKHQLLAKLERTRENIRNISHELMPPIFSYATIEEIIEDYVSHLNLPDSLQLSFEATPADWSRISQEVGYELYRIVQEGMNNILKHSSGSHASITLKMNDDSIQLEIFNNGILKHTLSKGIGMRTIEDRIKSINGTFNFVANESGVRLIITTPIK